MTSAAPFVRCKSVFRAGGSLQRFEVVPEPVFPVVVGEVFDEVDSEVALVGDLVVKKPGAIDVAGVDGVAKSEADVTAAPERVAKVPDELCRGGAAKGTFENDAFGFTQRGMLSGRDV